MPYFKSNESNMRAVINALMQMKAEADSAAASAEDVSQALQPPQPPHRQGPAQLHAAAAGAASRLTRQTLQAMTTQEVAESATARAGVVPAAECVEAVKMGGIIAVNYQEE